jgi:hypothetical protein
MQLKKILAAGAMAALMVGSTVFAATLADYPSPFVSGANVDSLVVVGANAKADDIAGAIDIAARMGSDTYEDYTVSATTGKITATGDAVKLAKSNNFLAYGEEVDTILTTLDKSDLSAMAGGSVSNEFGTFKYSEYLEVPTDADVIWAIDPDDATDTPAFYWFFDDTDTVYTYKLSFSTALKSDNDANDRLEDIENKQLTMFGKSYTIIKAEQQAANNLKLTLLGGEASTIAEHGEEVTVTVDTTTYTVKPLIYSSTEVVFTVNGETTDTLNEGETYKLADGKEIGVEDILYSSKETVTSSVKFWLGADKIVLEDTDITNDSAGGQALVVGSETIDGTEVQITGSSAGVSTGDDVTISQIQVKFDAEDDYYVPVGGGLSAELSEKDALFLKAFDWKFAGVEPATTELIEIKNSGDNKYELKFTNAAGDSITMPLLYSSGGTNIAYAKDANDKLVFMEDLTIDKDDYFVLNNDNTVGGNGITHVLQYKDLTASDDTIEFKDLGTGETIKITYTASGAGSNTGLDGYIILNGYKYGVAVQADSNDADLRIDLNADGSIDSGDEANIITQYGALIDIDVDDDTSQAIATTGEFMRFTTENKENAVAGDNVDLTVTASSGELDISVTSGDLTSTLLQIGSSDNYEGYTSYGAKFREETVSDGPDKVKITYPDDQLEFAVYGTSGDVTFSETGTTAGETVKKAVAVTMPIARLDSEIGQTEKSTKHLVLVGGPCANSVVAELASAGKVDTCDAWSLASGEGLIKLVEDAFVSGKSALIVAGTDAADTRAAAAVLQNYGAYTLTGTSVKVTTATKTVTEMA